MTAFCRPQGSQDRPIPEHRNNGWLEVVDFQHINISAEALCGPLVAVCMRDAIWPAVRSSRSPRGPMPLFTERAWCRQGPY